MKKIFVRLTLLSACFLIAHSIQAQNASDITATLNKFFGGNSAFTSKVDASIDSPQGSLTLPIKVAWQDGKVRLDIDLGSPEINVPNKIKGYADAIKKAGLEKITAVLRPDKNVAYVIWPGLKGYAEQAIPSSAVQDASSVKVESTKLGEETVNGHKTIKNKVVVTSSEGTQELTVWNAPALKDFPVKISGTAQGADFTLNFKDVKLGAPDAQQFEAPKDLTKHATVEALGLAAFEKIGSAL